MTDGLYSLYANQIAAVNPTEEQLAEYGLDEPYSVVSVSIDGVEQFTLRASERNSNNYVYMTKDGSPFVYLVSASRLSWLTVQVEQLTQSVYEPVELDELSSLTVESTDQSYTFLVTQGEEQTVTGNGEEVDSELFAELYRTITAIPPDELSSGEPSLEKVLTMTVRYLDEGRQEDVFELYPTGDGNVYISAQRRDPVHRFAGCGLPDFGQLPECTGRQGGFRTGLKKSKKEGEREKMPFLLFFCYEATGFNKLDNFFLYK